MRGFAGVLDKTRPEVDRAQLERALDAVTEGRKSDGVIVTCGRLGVALMPFAGVAQEAMFAISTDKSRLLVYDGAIHNLPDLRKEFCLPGDGNHPAAALLSAFGELEDGVFEKLEGMFSVAVFDAVQSKLTLARDHFGLGPLYVGDHDGRIYFGTRVDPLLALIRQSRVR